METQKFIDLVREKLGFMMENREKVERVIYGTSTGHGLVGGVGIDASPEKILAKYDELNGYITKNGFKVKNRTFFDFRTKKPIENPQVIYLIKMNGEFREQPEDAEDSLEMKVAKKQAQEEVEKLEEKIEAAKKEKEEAKK